MSTRTCTDCGRAATKTSRGLCPTCYGTRKRNNTPLPDPIRPTIHGRVDDVLEDAAFLAATGAGLHETARRTQTTPSALEKLLVRHMLHDLLALLKAHDEMPDVYLAGDRVDDRTHVTPRRAERGGAWKVA